MRIVVGFLIAACLVGFFLSRQHSEKTAETTAPASVAASAPVPGPQAREHHWPKAAFDRVDELKSQVAEQRKEQGK